MARKIRGIILLGIGCLLLLAAGVWYAYNIAEDNAAGDKADIILKALETATPQSTDTPVLLVDGDAFCGKVVIDKLGICLPVYNDWDYERLKSAPCRYAGSIAANDMIIAAHNYKSHFGALHRLAVGDKVKFIDALGNTHHFEACEIVTLDGTAVSDMTQSGWDLTLFTCTKGGKQRTTIRCKRK